MKKLKVFSLIATIALLVFCCVPSIHPFYTEQDIRFESSVLGIWEEDDGTIWDFRSDDNESYTLKYSSDSLTDWFEVNLFELGNFYYFDFYPTSDLQVTDLMITHLIPVHTLAKVVFSEDEIKVYSMKPEFISNLIEQNKIRIKHEEAEDYFILTASTEELQKFVIKYEREKNAFMEPLILKRR